MVLHKNIVSVLQVKSLKVPILGSLGGWGRGTSKEVSIYRIRNLVSVVVSVNGSILLLISKCSSGKNFA